MHNDYYYNYSLKPGQATIYYQSNNSRARFDDDKTNIKLPRNNSPNRNLSIKARKRITESIGWLLKFAEEKEIYNPRNNKRFKFKINFVTLTLPCLQFHRDKTLKEELLNPFLTYLRSYFELRNYVWRAECQANGSLHFHLATDTYIPWFIIRSTWNRQLRKLGYIDKYHNKFKSMGLQDYIKYSKKQGVKDLSIIAKRYDYGLKTNWKDPNTTDIHSVNKVNNLAAYLSKYMAKNESTKDEKGDYLLKYRKIEGKIWGRSQSLSRCKGIIGEVDSKMSTAFNWIATYLREFEIKETYFYYISFNFKRLQGWVKVLFKKLFADYKHSISYDPGGIPNKVYKLSSPF